MAIKVPTAHGALTISEHGGKMEGMHSISTNVNLNPFCKSRRELALMRGDGDCICIRCYADSLVNSRPGLGLCTEQNTYILSNHLLMSYELPVITDKVFRLESFGDLINPVHAANYLNICTRNQNTMFAIWSKNLNILKTCFEVYGMEKPKNLIIVQSSVHVNKKDEKFAPWVDKIFTVYTSSYALEKDIPINCGNKQCKNCLSCYSEEGRHEDIYEILKQDARSYYKALETGIYLPF